MNRYIIDVQGVGGSKPPVPIFNLFLINYLTFQIMAVTGSGGVKLPPVLSSPDAALTITNFHIKKGLQVAYACNPR